ncbi:MAG TPA: hypothetical protein VK837_07935 [Longimicrobiales bacterium]|nr:hypothetical protein [Longimicrobiales bacterium]
MGGPPELDYSRLRTVPVARRDNKVDSSQLAAPPAPPAEASFRAFYDSLPDILAASDLRALARAIALAARDRAPVVADPGAESGPEPRAAAEPRPTPSAGAVVCMMGGHVVKTGLSPVLIDLAERGVITAFAANGSTAIHDYELARWGGTSEDVEAGLADGTFGMAEETGRGINEAARAGAAGGLGLGEALAADLASRDDLAAPERSLLLAARKLGIPFTVHAAIGAEITHQHPATDGAAVGETSFRDFRRLAAHLEGLEGGVALNLGSAVIMPEVFLKALTVCRNANGGVPRAFVTADLDMIRHYRPRVNVVERPTRTGGGRGYQITGHHEIMVPLLAWAVVEELERG